MEIKHDAITHYFVIVPNSFAELHSEGKPSPLNMFITEDATDSVWVRYIGIHPDQQVRVSIYNDDDEIAFYQHLHALGIIDRPDNMGPNDPSIYFTTLKVDAKKMVLGLTYKTEGVEAIVSHGDKPVIVK